MKICTPLAERQNLTTRMQIRRLTRLTNAFNKKWETAGHRCACISRGITFAERIDAACNAAMESSVADDIWTLQELLA